jgi:hypothetical protein
VDALRKKKGPLGPELTDSALSPTGHICADCGENLTYAEEAWLLQVVQLQEIGGKLQSVYIVDEQDPDKDFLFTPYFFCFSCWENHIEELKEECDGQPPVEDRGCIADCFCCGSSILEGEYSGLISLGEFELSRRAPSGVAGATFAMRHAPDVICLYCLSVLNESFIEMWDELSQFGECMDCIFSRCWRAGPCACGCHTAHPESETEAQFVMERR